jgi:hypothetical protein
MAARALSRARWARTVTIRRRRAGAMRALSWATGLIFSRKVIDMLTVPASLPGASRTSHLWFVTGPGKRVSQTKRSGGWYTTMQSGVTRRVSTVLPSRQVIPSKSGPDTGSTSGAAANQSRVLRGSARNAKAVAISTIATASAVPSIVTWNHLELSVSRWRSAPTGCEGGFARRFCIVRTTE